MQQIKIVIFAVTLILTAITASNAQKLTSDKVPAAVKSAFKTKFPNVTKVKWELENKDYEGVFTLNGEEASANFEPNGKWLETEEEIEVSDLTAAVHTALKNDFAGYKVSEASKIESAENGYTYEAEIEKGEESWDVIFTAEGKVLSKTRIDEAKEKD
ncbi:MAG: PepSY-like domain-containing protein [Saprospiraceae bacterium]